MGAKFAVWKIRIKRAKEDFKQILTERMNWLKRRLTPDSSIIQEDFEAMVKAMSVAVPVAAKEYDALLEQYRFHIQAAKDISEVRKNLKGKIAALKAKPPKYIG